MARLPVPRSKSRSPTTSQKVPVASIDDALEAATDYAKASRSAATWSAYESDWQIFQTWCEVVGLRALPATPHTVALFIAAEAKQGRAPSTLSRRLAAIRLVHVGARVPSPHDAIEVDEVMRGIRRKWKRPPVQKAPAVDDEIKRMVDAVEPQTLRGMRDRALLLLGFAGAFRSFEFVGLDVDNLSQRDEGLSILIPSSKTDQEGHRPGRCYTSSSGRFAECSIGWWLPRSPPVRYSGA